MTHVWKQLQVVRSLVTVRRSVLLAMALLTCVPATAQTVRYVYDDAGRLVAVTDPSGETAVYTYDEVGNVISIARSSAAVRVLYLSPSSGSTGQAVRILGTGFSAVTSQNSVSFNGTSATVLSATDTELVANVPAGATTGLVSVTTPSGSGNSPDAFSVVASSSPTITGFTPAVGAPSTAATVTGTNFAPTPNVNRVSINSIVASVTSASGTSLGITVPKYVSSGRITVETVDGVATSVSDFFVPPPPYAVTDVQVTGRVTVGSGTNVVLSANKIGLILFDGNAGQRISVRATKISGSFGCNWSLRILRPNGGVTSSTLACSTDSLLEPQALSVTGTHTISVDPDGSGSGTYSITPYHVVDVVDPITANGPAIPAALTTPGQQARLPFTGSAGHRMSVMVTKLSGAFGCNWPIKILKSDGTLVGETLACQGSPYLLDPQTLPATGSYTVVADPLDVNTGTMTVNLYDVVDVTDPITPNGAAVTAALTTPGQQARLPFSGAAGQRMSVMFTKVSGTFDCNWPLKILKSDGTLVGQTTVCSTTYLLEPQTLPATGSYMVVADPLAANTGTMTLNLYAVVDVTDPITPNGAAVNAALTTPGQQARLPFSGTAGQRISMLVTQLSGNFGCNFKIQILNPNGTVLGQTTGCGGSPWLLEPQTLPTTGVYTAVVDPVTVSTGTANVNLYSVVDVTTPVTINGSAVAIPLTTPGQNARLPFSGTSGQQVTATASVASGSFGTGWRVKILKPDGTTLGSSSAGCGTCTLTTGSLTLPAAGTYTVLVDPVTFFTGTGTVTLTSP